MFFRDVTSLAREFEVESTFVTSLQLHQLDFFQCYMLNQIKKIAIRPINILESEFTYYTSGLVVKSLELHIGRSLGPRNSISGAVIILALVNSLWNIVVPHFCDDP